MATELTPTFRVNAFLNRASLSFLTLVLTALSLLGTAELAPITAAGSTPTKVMKSHAPERWKRKVSGPKPVVIRFRSSAAWSTSMILKVEEFYHKRFGRPLPISAYGQTRVHTKLGLNHRRAFDIAVCPDSIFGQELRKFLVSARFPFIAFRRAVPGSATAPHIHIGPQSTRFRKNYSRR